MILRLRLRLRLNLTLILGLRLGLSWGGVGCGRYLLRNGSKPSGPLGIEHRCVAARDHRLGGEGC